MDVLLYICCIFSKHLFLRTSLDGCFWKLKYHVITLLWHATSSTGASWNSILKFFKFKNEINRRIELKSRLKKGGHFSICYFYSHSEYFHYRPQNVKNGSFFVFSADGSKIGKVWKCIWKMLFSSFRKCHELLASELPAWCKPLKIQDFSIFYWLSSFLDISTFIISWAVAAEPINHTIFWKNSIRSFRCT